jgi:hypothetical protein
MKKQSVTLKICLFPVPFLATSFLLSGEISVAEKFAPCLQPPPGAEEPYKLVWPKKERPPRTLENVGKQKSEVAAAKNMAAMGMAMSRIGGIF